MDKKFLELFKQIQEDHKLQESRTRNDKVLIVDGTNSYIRIWSASPLLSETGEHIGGTYGFMRSIAAAVRQHKPTRVIITFDGQGGSQRRRKLYPEYKENRTLSKSFNRSDQVFLTEDQEMQSLNYQFGRLIEYLLCLPVTVISLDHIEADDVIAYLVTSYCKNQCIIMSDDKDFLQLINDKVHVWRPVEKKLYNEKALYDRFGVPAYNYLMYKLFIGDDSDNIPGINGVGPKTIVNKLILLQDKKVGVDDIIKFCEENTANIFKKILEQKDQLYLNHKLMQLHDVDISGVIKSNIHNIVDGPIQQMNKFGFMKMYMDDKAYNVIPDIESWLKNSFSHLDSFSEK